MFYAIFQVNVDELVFCRFLLCFTYVHVSV